MWPNTIYVRAVKFIPVSPNRGFRTNAQAQGKNRNKYEKVQE
jgi:hypothetical protein